MFIVEFKTNAMKSCSIFRLFRLFLEEKLSLFAFKSLKKKFTTENETKKIKTGSFYM